MHSGRGEAIELCHENWRAVKAEVQAPLQLQWLLPTLPGFTIKFTLSLAIAAPGTEETAEGQYGHSSTL